MSEHPFLILTLRRTGGTSLMAYLSSVSGHPTVEHEPFNPDRKWGHITTGFRTTGDEAALQHQIDACLKTPPNIKHAIELTPPELTRALINGCTARGYAIFLLTRRDEVARQRSLMLAKATGAWGTKQAAEIYPRIIAGEVQPGPVDLPALERGIAGDLISLAHTLILLRNRRVPYEWLVFEELYHSPDGIIPKATRIAQALGITVTEDDPRTRAVAEGTGQDSDRIEPYVPGMAAALTLLRQRCLS